MTIDYKVSLFLHLHNDLSYNSLGSTCACHYLLVGTNVPQSASLLKLNFQFFGGPAILQIIHTCCTTGCYNVVVGLLFIHGTLAQV